MVARSAPLFHAARLPQGVRHHGRRSANGRGPRPPWALRVASTAGDSQGISDTVAPSPVPTASDAPMTTEAAMRAYARTVLAPRTSLGSRISQAFVTAEHVDCLAGAALRQRLNEVAAGGRDDPNDVTRCVIVLSGH